MPNLWATLCSDMHRLAGQSSVPTFIRLLAVNRPFRTIVTFRLRSHSLRHPSSLSRLFALPLRLLHRWTQGRIGFELPPTVEVGVGLLIYHGWGLVINAKTQIGSNVTLLHAVTLAGVRTGSPRIGDDVTISTGAIVIGRVTIGSGSVIGAGAIVTKDVPPNTVVAGNPARVLKANPQPYVPNPVPIVGLSPHRRL